MKKLLIFCFAVSLSFFSNGLFAQSEMKDVTVAEFSPPYESITILVDDEEFELVVNEETGFKRKKGQLLAEEVIAGFKVNVRYEIADGERVAKLITLSSEIDAGKLNFTGILEAIDGDMAFVDGRKIKLKKGASIECSGKKDCNCSKGVEYINFGEVKVGNFLTVSGEMTADGVVEAARVKVCKNTFTKEEEMLRASVENSYNGANLVKVNNVPQEVFNPANGLYNGNIKIGTLEFKLLNDIRIQGYVNLVGNRILPDYARDPDYTEKNKIIWRFYVIDNPIPNAFAFPNGMVFVHTGILQLMENEAQLAAVLGHEIAHVTYEHASARFKTFSLTNSGMAIKVFKKLPNWVKGKGAKDTDIPAAMLEGASLALNKTRPSDIANVFEKSKETQSDRVGLYYMFSAGYDVREAARFWKIMSDVTRDEKFLDKAAADAKSLLLTNELNFEKGFLSNLGTQGTELLVGNLLETVYTSHPLTSKRYDDINLLLGTVYKDADMETAFIGKEEYVQFISQ